MELWAETNHLPKGWNEKRVRKVLRHYETQTEDQAVAEDEMARKERTTVQVPRELLPVVRELIRLYQVRGRAKA
ncbi:MAG: hypothetical protein HZC40_09155 [Chloroflexi bacterium]|nr:hypothetical protein [Chloroflexota bacterium]